MQYIVVSFIAWVLAQVFKHAVRLLGKNRRIFSKQSRHTIMLSGGMPSAHSATVIALATSIGLHEGWNSAIFALASVLAAVVVYDAVMVRYSSGQQGDALNGLLEKSGNGEDLIDVAHGHTVLEAIAGVLLGCVVAFVAFFTTQ